MQKGRVYLLDIFIAAVLIICTSSAFGRIEGARGIAISGNYAYVVYAGKGIKIIDISNQNSLSAKNGEIYDTRNGSIGNVKIASLFASDNPYLVGSIPINNPIDIKIAGKYIYASGSVFAKNLTDIKVIGENEYVAGSLYVIDVSDPHNPHVVNQLGLTRGIPYGMEVENNYLYTADTEMASHGYTAGLTIYDVSSKVAPVKVGHIAAKNPTGIKVIGNYAYVADGFDGLKIFDVQNPRVPVLVGSIPTDCAVKVDVVGGYAYVADDTSGMKIIDVSNPKSPALVGSTAATDINNARGIKVVGSYAYIADYTSGLKIFDINNPKKPFLVCSVAAEEAQGVVVDGDYVILAAGTEGLNVIETNLPHSIDTSWWQWWYTVVAVGVGTAVIAATTVIIGGTTIITCCCGAHGNHC